MLYRIMLLSLVEDIMNLMCLNSSKRPGRRERMSFIAQSSHNSWILSTRKGNMLLLSAPEPVLLMLVSILWLRRLLRRE